MTTPLVSIITPNYNSSEFLKETIESVIAQTYKNWEMLIIDDGSKDDSLTIARSFQDSRIKIYQNERNLGVASTRNKGIDISQGEFIAFLDSDDLWLPQKLEKQIEVSLGEKSNFIISEYDFISEDGEYLRTYRLPKRAAKEELLKGSFIGCLTVLVSRDLVGSSRFKKIFHEDYVLWLEILAKEGARLSPIRTPLAKYRERKNSLSANKIKCAKEQWGIYRRELGLPLHKTMVNFVSYLFKGVFKHYL